MTFFLDFNVPFQVTIGGELTLLWGREKKLVGGELWWEGLNFDGGEFGHFLTDEGGQGSPP